MDLEALDARGQRKEVEELELDVAEMSVSNSVLWEWALEIENTEWLFKVPKERFLFVG